MAEDSEEALEERIEQIQRRAENFRDLLKDGEEITISYLDGTLLITESYRSQFERKYPKLFGRMMSIEAQLETGWVPYFLGMFVVGVFIFGLQLAWWEPLLGHDASELLNRWWFYLVLPAAVLYLVSLICGQWQKYVFRRHRQELFQLIDNERLDRDILLVMLRDIDDLDYVVRELKLDRSPFNIAPEKPR